MRHTFDAWGWFRTLLSTSFGGSDVDNVTGDSSKTDDCGQTGDCSRLVTVMLLMLLPRLVVVGGLVVIKSLVVLESFVICEKWIVEKLVMVVILIQDLCWDKRLVCPRELKKKKFFVHDIICELFVRSEVWKRFYFHDQKNYFWRIYSFSDSWKNSWKTVATYRRFFQGSKILVLCPKHKLGYRVKYG